MKFLGVTILQGVEFSIFPIDFNWALQPSSAVITACTVVQAVVKATSQSNGKGQISTPWVSETPELISMKLGIYNRVEGMPTHANPCGAATTWVVWANPWKHACFGFLGVPFFKVVCFILRLTPSAHTCSDFDDLYVIRRVSAQGCAFWGLVHTAPHFGGKMPQKPLIWGRE